MRGNQAIINQSIFEHPDNPIKEKRGDVDPMNVIYMITEESWKQWRRDLTHAETPFVRYPGLGDFSLMYGKSKSYLRKVLGKIRRIRQNHADTYLIEGTKANGRHNFWMTRFRETWKQVDKIKVQVLKNLEIWKQKKIAKYGDKAIL